MPAIEKSSLIVRLRHTKVTELLHGRLSRGTTPQQVIAASGLDASTRSLIADIVKRARLWNDERVDVARELIAHFADARDAGESSEKTIRAFGDPDAAAKLIRRAKIRNRSLLWQTLRFLRRAAAALLLGYILLAIYFSLGTPRISVDYMARINGPIMRIPQDQRAWPYYRQLHESLEAEMEARGSAAFDVYPGVSDKKWPVIVEWLKTHPQLLALADEATARPSMGFIYGIEGSVRDMKNFANQQADKSDPFYNALLGVLLPQLNHMRQTANILASDARLAAEQRDADRWLKRMGQIHQIGEHASESGFVVSHLVHIGIEALRLAQIQRMLVEHPDLLSEKLLAELAHQNVTYQKPDDLMSYDGERMMFNDVVQRIYTDDGKGDGYISSRGISNIEVLTTFSGPPRRTGVGAQLARFAISPAAALMMASRRDITEKYDYFMSKIERNLNVPWRERRDLSLDAEVMELKTAPISRFRYLLITVLLPSLDRANLTAERFLTMRDAAQVGIALELYRRRIGAYPQTLEALSPTLLPTIPLDPVDGLPLKYRLIDGKPRVYSVGTDLDDDGGAMPIAKPGTNAAIRHRTATGSELAIGSNDTDYDGDWILYPEPYTPDPDPEEEDATTLPLAEPITQPAG